MKFGFEIFSMWLKFVILGMLVLLMFIVLMVLYLMSFMLILAGRINLFKVVVVI